MCVSIVLTDIVNFPLLLSNLSSVKLCKTKYHKEGRLGATVFFLIHIYGNVYPSAGVVTGNGLFPLAVG